MRCWHPAWRVPASKPHPWENGDVLVGSAPCQHHPGRGAAPGQPHILGHLGFGAWGLRWGGEKGFPPVRPPGSRAECECLPAAFLIACSMAGVIQRRAEASAATETTMKRKRSSKKFSVHKSAELQVIPGQGRAKEKRRLEAVGQNVPTRTLGWG